MPEEWNADQLLDLRLQAKGLGGLLPLLDSAKGAILAGRYRIDRLLAAGSQAFVFAAQDLTSGRDVVVKQAAFDYRKPIRYGEKLIAEHRQALAHEFDVLRACQSPAFPRPIAMLKGPAVVRAAERNHA